MKKLLLLAALAIFIAGCTTSNERIHPDVITIPEKEYVVHNTEPYAGSTTTIEFNVVNEGKDIANGVEINFFEPSSFKVLSLNCGSLFSGGTEKSCVLNNMRPTEKRRVTATLLATDKDIKSPMHEDVSFFMQYDFTGKRTAVVPVVEGVEEPPQPYQPSGPSDGPVQLEFLPPVGGKQMQGQQEVERHWAHKGIPFEMKMNFKHVGSKSFGIPKEPIIITAGNLRIDLDGVKVAYVDDKSICKLFSDLGNSIVSKEDIEVPSEFSCTFVSSAANTDQKYYNAIFDASFTYTYQITKTESFTIKPVE